MFLKKTCFSKRRTSEKVEDPDNPDSEDLTHPDVDRHHYLEEVNELTQEEWNDLLQI